MDPLDPLINELKRFQVRELLRPAGDVGVGQLNGEQVADAARRLGLEKFEGHVLQILVPDHCAREQRGGFIDAFDDHDWFMLALASRQSTGGIARADNLMRESKANHRFLETLEGGFALNLS